MSRSNPQENGVPNPATRWFEWNGETGAIRYYDKDVKQNVEVGSDFTFLLLDQVGRVGGWDKEGDCAIYSNDVKDTRQEVLVVRSRKSGTIAEGIYQDIKDRVIRMGGKFVANCYIAYKNGGSSLKIGSLQFQGAALHAWAEFQKANRADLYKKAIRINGFTEGKKGKIVFRVPILTLKDISSESDAAAVALDKELQEYLASYFKRTKRDQVEAPQHHDDDTDSGDYDDEPADEAQLPDLTDVDIPF